MKVLAFIISMVSYALIPIPSTEIDHSQKVEIEDVGNASFAKFLSCFEKVDVPDEIDHLKIQDYKTTYTEKGKYISNNDIRKELKNYINEAKVSKFSRIGPPIVIPLNRFYPNENTIAVTYIVRQYYDAHGFEVRLALYDLKGNSKIKPKKKKKGKSKFRASNSTLIAGYHIDETTLCSFHKSNSIIVSTYKNEWKKDFNKFGIDDNKITSYIKKKSDLFQVQTNGTIAVSEAPTSFASI